MAQSSNDIDPFDTLLTLEDSLYTTAYSQGVADGSRAGRIEGRVFGLEKGFEKFAALGELHGRSAVWAGRLPHSSKSNPNGPAVNEKEKAIEQEKQGKQLPNLPANSRLQNNITLLHSLTDLETFSTDNTEEAVADFDDRFKRAGAKAKVIERIVGEGSASGTRSPSSPSAGSANKPSLLGGAKKSADSGMEDFAGGPMLR